MFKLTFIACSSLASNLLGTWLEPNCRAIVPYLRLLFVAGLWRFQLLYWEGAHNADDQYGNTAVLLAELSWIIRLNIWFAVEIWALKGSKIGLILSSIKSDKTPVIVSQILSALRALDASMAFSVFTDLFFWNVVFG